MKVHITQSEIMQNWGYCNKPKVSIICISYNHARFIEDSLDGFLMQKTNFPFEIVVHDDASLDCSQEIINKYAKKYPDIIRPILQKENQYSKGKRIIPLVVPYAKAPYIALCEGDDFWKDKEKLQLQFDFLEKNSEYVICYHNAEVIDEHGKLVKPIRVEGLRSLSSRELKCLKCPIPTLTMMFRNVIYEFPHEFDMQQNGDTFLISLLGRYGKGKYLPEIKPACYRLHSDSLWSSLKMHDRRLINIKSFYWMQAYYSRIGDSEMADHFKLKAFRLFLLVFDPFPPIRIKTTIRLAFPFVLKIRSFFRRIIANFLKS